MVFYRHDDAGRVVEKRVEEQGFRPKTWQMQWDAQSRLVRLTTPDGAVWRYVYDALGRRIQRLKLIAGGKGAADAIPEGGGRAYQWEGSQIVAEAPILADGSTDWAAAAHWIYEPGSYRPLARASGDGLHYVVTDHIGTPRELFCEDGTAVAYRQELSLWGEVEPITLPRRAANDDTAPVDCPIRFQGQWLDEESGLHYNCMRYYDPEATQYLTPDPIGLLGGMRTQAYVADPNGWVDPLGLRPCSQTLKRNMLRNEGHDPNQNLPHYQAQHLIPGEFMDPSKPDKMHPALVAAGLDINAAANGIFLRNNRGGVSPLSRHQGSHPAYSRAVQDALDRIDLNRPQADIAADIARLQRVLYTNQMAGVPIRNKDMVGSATARFYGLSRQEATALGGQRVYDMWDGILKGRDSDVRDRLCSRTCAFLRLAPAFVRCPSRSLACGCGNRDRPRARDDFGKRAGSARRIRDLARCLCCCKSVLFQHGRGPRRRKIAAEAALRQVSDIERLEGRPSRPSFTNSGTRSRARSLTSSTPSRSAASFWAKRFRNSSRICSRSIARAFTPAVCARTEGWWLLIPRLWAASISLQPRAVDFPAEAGRKEKA
ncbi:RHS repeat domain-containing protein [Paracoccus cavernae]|uniref:RHS repeat domain-containing protein n=1 Tax=Paracoccus cavernae TaxID=1571207 RepID=UPI00363C4D84